MSDTVIRASTTSDIPDMQLVETRAAELFRGSHLIDPDNMDCLSHDEHLAAIQHGVSFVAQIDGKVQAFVMGDIRGADGYLHELDVHPDHQRKKLGALLVLVFADKCRALSLKSVYLNTFRDPPWNRPFYARMGFSEVKRQDYLGWMDDIETEQSEFLDLTTRVFMRLPL